MYSRSGGPLSRGLSLFDDQLAVHQYKVTRKRAEKRVVAARRQLRGVELNRHRLTATHHIGGGKDARVSSREIVRRACGLSGLRNRHVIGRRTEHPVMPHDVGGKLPDVLQSERNFLAALLDVQLFGVELNLVIRFDRKGTLLAPCLLAEKATGQRQHPEHPFHRLYAPNAGQGQKLLGW